MEEIVITCACCGNTASYPLQKESIRCRYCRQPVIPANPARKDKADSAAHTGGSAKARVVGNSHGAGTVLSDGRSLSVRCSAI